MNIKSKILIPIILIGILTTMITYANLTALSPAQIQEQKEKVIKEELKTTITPIVKIEPFVVNPIEITSPITKKIAPDSKTELVTYKLGDNTEFDLRAKINGTDKELPFKNIVTTDWINTDQILVVTYDTLKDPTKKNFIYKINPEDKSQGVYVYNTSTGSSTNIWNKPKDNLFYQARVGELGGQKIIVLNTTQTLEIISLNGERIKTLFYNFDIKDHPQSYISFQIKQPDNNKISFEVVGITPNTKKFNLEL